MFGNCEANLVKYFEWSLLLLIGRFIYCYVFAHCLKDHWMCLIISRNGQTRTWFRAKRAIEEKKHLTLTTTRLLAMLDTYHTYHKTWLSGKRGRIDAAIVWIHLNYRVLVFLDMIFTTPTLPLRNIREWNYGQKH